MERLTPASAAWGEDRDRIRQALSDAGILGELGPGLLKLADPAVRPEDVEAALMRAGGPPLSEIILEQRGPRE